MPGSRQQNERLVALLIIGLIALNYPLLSLFSKVKLVYGIPVLYLYLFAVWYLFIACVALVLAKPGPPPAAARSPESEKSG